MSNEELKLVKILKTSEISAGCENKDCDSCNPVENGSICVYLYLAKVLIHEGVVVPILCKDCGSYDPELGICKIRHDSWGGPLERGPHDWCSDGGVKS